MPRPRVVKGRLIWDIEELDVAFKALPREGGDGGEVEELVGRFLMTRIRLRHIDRFVDNQGKVRHYFRRGRGARVPLPSAPGTPEFMMAYQSALDGTGPGQKKYRGAAGTMDRLIQEYFESSDYARLAASSKRPYRLVIERWVRDDDIGHRLVRQMTRQHIDRMLAKRQATPGAANDLLKKIRILMRFAVSCHWRNDDPSLGIRRFSGGTFHTWTEGEIAAFEKRWPVGSPERLAFALLLYTGQRQSDVVRMSWGDIDGDCIRVVQQKTKAKLVIPLHPDLGKMLEHWPKIHLVILTTRQGRPFTPAGFGGWMAEKIAAAGLPERCVTHGLRKAAARRLAEAGCTTLQIMSITGHKSLQEVERYTRETEQQRSAQAAINKLTRRTANKDSQMSEIIWEKSGKDQSIQS